MSDSSTSATSELDEEILDFGRRFARLIVTRGFREGCPETDEAARGADSNGASTSTSTSAGAGAVARFPSALEASVIEAETSLRASQRLAVQLQDEADALRFRVLPSLRENASQLQALFVAIDRVSDQVLPEIDEAVTRMEKAMYRMEEMRKEQVETGSPHGSYGLGSPWGAGLWAPRKTKVCLPEIFETNKIFHAEEGGLRPL